MKTAVNVAGEATVAKFTQELVALANALRKTADTLVTTGAVIQTLCLQVGNDLTGKVERQVAAIEPKRNADRPTMPGIPPLDFETRTTVDTRTAAFHLNREEQTLQTWACHENGPVRPLRINGRLAWTVVELQHMLGGAAPCIVDSDKARSRARTRMTVADIVSRNRKS